MEHFRGQVSGTATEGFGEVFLSDVLLCEAEVSEATVTVRVNENIFRLEISVNDIKRVDVLDGQHDFGDEEPGLVLLKDLLFVEVEGEVAARAVVQDHVEVVGSLEAVVHFDHEGVVSILQDVALSDGVLQVLVPVQESFFQDFHREFLALTLLFAFENLSESPMPE